MTLFQALQFLFISAIWGASHVFVREIVPACGPAFTAFARIFIGALVLQLILLFQKQNPFRKEFLKHYLIVGFAMYALPLTLFAFAGVHLPATYMVILNATAPIFSAVFSSLYLGDPFGLKKVISITLGITGVTLLAQYGTIEKFDLGTSVALVLGLLASACYAWVGVYVKKRATQVPSLLLTSGSTWFAVLFVAPLMFTTGAVPPASAFTIPVTLSLLTLGALGTAVAFVIFYRLIPQIGAFKTSMVAFLMPVFGMIWGHLFLKEELTSGMLLGAAMVIGATAMFMKKPREAKSA